MIYFFYLHTPIRLKCMVLSHIFFLCVQSFDQKLGSSLIYFFYLCTTIRPKLGFILTLQLILFLIVAIFRTLYSWQHYPCISYAIFMSSTTLTFRTLYSWLYEVLANKGPRIDPCSTPHDMLETAEKELSKFTVNLRFDR